MCKIVKHITECLSKKKNNNKFKYGIINIKICIIKSRCIFNHIFEFIIEFSWVFNKSS